MATPPGVNAGYIASAEDLWSGLNQGEIVVDGSTITDGIVSSTSDNRPNRFRPLGRNADFTDLSRTVLRYRFTPLDGQVTILIVSVPTISGTLLQA